MTDPFFLELLVSVLLTGILLSLITAPLGCFVVWRSLGYFGDAVAHGTLSGVALSLAFGWSLEFGALLSALVFGLLLVYLRSRTKLSSSSALGILAHAFLAGGLLLLTFFRVPNFDMEAYLFGNILVINPYEIGLLSVVALLGVGFLCVYWRPLVFLTLHEELARAEGVKASRMELLFMVWMTISVAVSVRLIGVLLVAAMLLIPAASVRPFAKSPFRSVLWSVGFSWVAFLLGTALSLKTDAPLGPAVVFFASVLFLPSLFLSRR